MSSHELCFGVEIINSNHGIYDQLVRTGSFSSSDKDRLNNDYFLLTQALKKTKKELKLQIREWRKFKHVSGSIFILMANQCLFEILEEWRLKYGIVQQSEVYFIDKNSRFKKEDIIEIKIIHVGLDHFDNLGLSQVELLI